MPALYPDCPQTVRLVQVGGLTKLEILREFERHEISMNPQGNQLFREMPISIDAYRLETVQFQLRCLGFRDGAISAQILNRAGELGLSVCSLEAAAYLRLAFLDQPEGPWITIASDRQREESQKPTGFYLRRREDGIWLRGYTASADHPWNPDEEFIFCRVE